ncbi:hypothetical protein O181_126195 [Austropuccinia psidii MF-1]|uniref:Uncharacterized protein n=1 Tax=Austropuccinia psidii MF-1 TaxID=1389203 RepID=A0A9Q3KW59_9BASI|nr:hypothetical protein [Austropuccinia psidii MF-1]
MNSIKEYVLDLENPCRIDKESFLKYYDKISYWKLLTPREEPAYLILPYIEFKNIYYKAPIKAKGKKWLRNISRLKISRIEFMDWLSEEALRGNLRNKYWEEIFSFDEKNKEGSL